MKSPKYFKILLFPPFLLKWYVWPKVINKSYFQESNLWAGHYERQKVVAGSRRYRLHTEANSNTHRASSPTSLIPTCGTGKDKTTHCLEDK